MVVIGIGYAFFSASVSNTNHETLSTDTATIALRFADNDSGISANLKLGESVVKKFTLENTGTKDAYAKINWYNLVNTYTTQSLSYNLEQSESEDGTYSSIDTGNVPISNTETTLPLKNGILVPISTKYYYKLTITLNNLEINQNSDINATFHSHFRLEEGSQITSGTNKIKMMVKNANIASHAAITVENEETQTCTNTLAYDGTSDNNLRYIGENPCNHVCFNDECSSGDVYYYPAKIDGSYSLKGYDGYEKTTKQACYDLFDEEDFGVWDCFATVKQKTYGWRIIGVMNNVDDGTGKKETRLKIIRDKPIGSYSYNIISQIPDSSLAGDYTDSVLQKELNGDYLNPNLTENPTWFTRTTFDRTLSLKKSAQDLIDDAVWDVSGANMGNAINFYNSEKSGISYNNARPTTWTGKVGIMRASDFGLATNGTSVKSREECLDTILSSVYPNTCVDNNYFLNEDFSATMSVPSYLNNNIFFLVKINQIGIHERNESVGESSSIKPVVYLKSNVTITEGNGSAENPYRLSLN